ncbi:MAG: hypothetical protein D6819_06035 [Gammaproteobacteria bacterium]|nr:MAG: hypothetical protein D6819_06035 [Gammaproteobacteria bacterium]
MSIHLPFCGKTGRVMGRMDVFAFFDAHHFSPELQERYYRWWYEWAKKKVMEDPDLRAAYAPLFNRYPFGQHALHSFHLKKEYIWAVAMEDLGALICQVILPKLDEQEKEALMQAYRKMLEALDEEARSHPHELPELGYLRHI